MKRKMAIRRNGTDLTHIRVLYAQIDFHSIRNCVFVHTKIYSFEQCACKLVFGRHLYEEKEKQKRYKCVCTLYSICLCSHAIETNDEEKYTRFASFSCSVLFYFICVLFYFLQ